jgi:chemotaxis signal transduction protein
MELVLFQIGSSRFAFSAAGVIKVLDLLPLTPLPYAPPDVEGLVNVAGSVLLKVDLAARLGMPARSASAEGNLLVLAAGQDTIVVQVDRVFNKINLEPAAIKSYSDSQSEDDTGNGRNAKAIVMAEFSLPDGMVLLLNEAALGLQEMNPVGVPYGGGGLLGRSQDTDARPTQNVVSSDIQTVTVQDGGETYAFLMESVMEIVEIKELTALPGASAEVEGLMDLRGKALLVLSMARILKRVQKVSPRFVLVLSVDGARLGVSVSDIVGIERYARDDVQAVTGGDSQLEGYLTGVGPRHGHMTGLISVAGLVPPEKMSLFRRYLNEHGLELSSMSDREHKTMRRLLAFRLGEERCALPLSCIDRVEEFSASVELPQGDSTLAGVVQIKGVVAPVLDMRDMLGVSKSDQAAYIVVRVDDAIWALIVDKVDRVIEIAEKDISPVRTGENDYLTEVGRLNGELISLLSLEPLSRAAHA